MTQFYECFACHKVYPLTNDKDIQLAEHKTCASCGAANGQVISGERFDKGHKGGVYYDIDPTTGKRRKP